MVSKHLEYKLERRTERAMTLIPAVQMILRIVLVAVILLGCKMACDGLVSKAVHDQQIEDSR